MLFPNYILGKHYWENPGYPQESINEKERCVTRSYKVPFSGFANHSFFLDHLHGHHNWRADKFSIIRNLPDQDARYKDLFCLTSKTIPWADVTAAGTTSANYNYDWCTVEANYYQVPFNCLLDTQVGGDEKRRFVEIKSTSRIDYISQGQTNAMLFNQTGTALQHGVGFPLPMTVITAKWYSVPSLIKLPTYWLNPMQKKIDFYCGCLNSKPFMTFPRGTVLFEGCSDCELVARPFNYIDGINSPVFNISYQFALRDPRNTPISQDPNDPAPHIVYGHNGFYDITNGTGGKWDWLVARRGNAPFPQEDFQQDVPAVRLLFRYKDLNDLFTGIDLPGS